PDQRGRLRTTRPSAQRRETPGARGSTRPADSRPPRRVAPCDRLPCAGGTRASAADWYRPAIRLRSWAFPIWQLAIPCSSVLDRITPASAAAPSNARGCPLEAEVRRPPDLR